MLKVLSAPQRQRVIASTVVDVVDFDGRQRRVPRKPVVWTQLGNHEYQRFTDKPRNGTRWRIPHWSLCTSMLRVETNPVSFFRK